VREVVAGRVNAERRPEKDGTANTQNQITMSEKQTPTIDAGVVAVICHQANKALCERLGDFSQKDWSEASEESREAAISNIEAYLDGKKPKDDDLEGKIYASLVDALLPKGEKPVKKAATKAATK